jgi:hypothetical protein
MPGTIAGIRHVTDSAQVTCEQVFQSQSQIVRIGRAASLISHHLKKRLLPSQPHDRLHEIIPHMSIEPGCSNHQRVGTARQCGDFSLAFGLPIHINGMGHVLFTIGSRLGSIEDIVRRHIDQSRVKRRGGTGHKGSALGVHRHRTIGLAFGPIDIGIGTDMQNDRGTGSHDLGFAVRTREVKLRQVFEDQVFSRKGLLERMTQLPLRARN